MVYYYARNIVWGELETDNSVDVTFNIFADSGDQVDGEQSVHGPVADIQQLIEDKVREKSAAVALYESISENDEFQIEMSS